MQISSLSSLSTSSLIVVIACCLLVIIKIDAEDVTVCEGYRLAIKCPENTGIIISRANYGRTARDAGSCDKSDTVNCYYADTLATVQLKCFGLQTCDIDVLTRNFGDSCPVVPKYLNVSYECVRTEQLHTLCKQNEISDTEGYIISPNYPKPYEPGLICSMDISSSRPSSGLRTRMSLLDLDLETKAPTGCNDWLFLQEKDSPAEKLDYCGGMSLQPHDIVFDHLQLRCEFNAAIQKRGFLIKYKVDKFPKTMFNQPGPGQLAVVPEAAKEPQPAVGFAAQPAAVGLAAQPAVAFGAKPAAGFAAQPAAGIAPQRGAGAPEYVVDIDKDNTVTIKLNLELIVFILVIIVAVMVCLTCRNKMCMIVYQLATKIAAVSDVSKRH